MKVISGCVIVKDNKILMVKEDKKKCYGQWNYPAGHVDEKDEILEVKWIDIEEIKNMTAKELRGYEINIKTLDDLEQKRIYPLEIFDNGKYTG